MKLHVFSLNCDCASSYITRKRMPRWCIGPRCPYCNTLLGPMQYMYYGQGEGEDVNEIIKKVGAAFQKELEKRFSREGENPDK